MSSAQEDRSARTSGTAAPAAPRVTGWRESAGSLALGPAVFEGGRLVRLGGRAASGPRLELFRAPTDNDEGGGFSDPTGSDDSVAGVSNASLWRAAGLDRLVGRLLTFQEAPGALRTLSRVSAADSARFLTVETVWTLAGDELELRVEIEPSAGWPTVWPRIGVRVDLPDGDEPIRGAEWFGLGPRESYPDSMRAARLGRYAATVEELSVAYARPQETGHRSAVRELTVGPLTLRALPDGRGRLPGFVLTRHTPQQLAAAAHPHELPASDTTYLFLDAAQHGLGSRACGPDVWPEFALRPEARTLRVRITA